MTIEKEQITSFILKLGFKPVDGEKDRWLKKYALHSDYVIKIDLSNPFLSKCTINYGKKIVVGRRTTSNFSQEENLVILECVNGLLSKGYPPESIVLEKKWKLGRKSKGYLDIWILDHNRKSYLMIECKTFGAEHETEKRRIISNGGQLFSYFVQEPKTEYLCLYSSRYSKNNIEYSSDIIKVQSSFKNKSQKEAHEIWNKIFSNNGLFEEEILPYRYREKGTTKNSLVELKANDGGIIFNQFAEILRRQVVSDKPNAFNKIFNLFLCKIVDEDSKDADEMMDFQWRDEEDNKTVMLRLNDLYKKGMKNYLKLEITDYSQKEIEKILRDIDENSVPKLKEIITELRLYTNNEFAFKEVFDKKTFDENCIVVKEVVQLLQGYRLKYTSKHQFLGDFFERLLNTGIKQEAGQFFTPIPIARFICKSIPIEKIIKDKNESRVSNFLPYVIDYASGSGHFLTEMMSELEKYVTTIDSKWIKGGKRARDFFEEIKRNYSWAKTFIYGIEKDYRLSKTSKVNCFLNGDGDANIFRADGLASFTSNEYNGILKTRSFSKNNPVFDILVSNPPYSVQGFKNTLKDGDRNFGLFQEILTNGSEIECLFIERAEQLLCPKGYIGIILPSSILWNGGVYEKAREIILEKFDIKAIVRLGCNTFMATTTNTVVLFMRKKEVNDVPHIKKIIDDFIKKLEDVACNNIPKFFSTFAGAIYNINFNEYLALLDGKYDKKYENLFYQYEKAFSQSLEAKNIKSSVDFKESSEADKRTVLSKVFSNYIKKAESEKLVYFALTYGKDVVIVNSGEKEIEKEFLGYEFSKRRGSEGIKIHYDENQKIISKLYNDNEIEDESKVNIYILQSFNDEPISNVHDDLKEHLKIRKMHNVLSFSQGIFEKKIILTPIPEIQSKFEKVPLFKACSTIDTGTNAPQHQKYFENGKYPFIRAGNLNNKNIFNIVVPNQKSMVNELAIKECDLKKFPVGTIIFPKSGQSIKTDNIAILGSESFIVNHLACLYDADKITLKYLYYLLEDFGMSNILAIHSGYPSINLEEIRNFKVPLPPKPVQENIVNDFFEIEVAKDKIEKDISKLKNKIQEIVDDVYTKTATVPFAKYCEPPQYGANEPAIKITASHEYRYIRITDIDDEGRLIGTPRTTRNIDEKYVLTDGDVLFARTGYTVGKTFLYKKGMQKAIFAGYLIRFKTKRDHLLPEFLNIIVKGTKFKTWVKSKKRMLEQFNINATEFGEFQIPDISVQQQETILKSVLPLQDEVFTLREKLDELQLQRNEILPKYLL